MARTYPLEPPPPQYILDMVNQVLRIRDYYTLVTERPEVDAHPDNVMLPEQYDVLMNTIKLNWYNTGRQAIINVRGIRNATPAFAIDDILSPEPDPVDYYYSDEGYVYRTKDPHPTTGSGGSKPKPPFPPWPPPGPIWPPLNWYPPAEETWSYCYRLNELVVYYVGDQLITPLEFQYWGYFLSEFLKNVYQLYRFGNEEAVARAYFLPWADLLETTLPTR